MSQVAQMLAVLLDMSSLTHSCEDMKKIFTLHAGSEGR